MTANVNPKTGIRYGVINGRSLDDEVYNDLCYGPQAKDLSYEAALEELKKEARSRYEDARELAEGSFENAVDAGNQPDIEAAKLDYIDEYLEHKLGTSSTDNVDDYIDWVVERENDFQIDEPEIEGESDGVKYRISWLGGAPLVWILEGPVGFANRLCSPCVPNAADLDGGFYTQEEFDIAAANRPDGMADDLDDGYECYVPPRDWLRSDDA